MRLTVVGCSGTLPGPADPCSAYLFEQEGFRLLVDVGNGAVGVLQRHVGLFDVDAVLVTHLHPDHYVDLVPYGYARRYHPSGPAPTLPVYGPAGTAEAMAVVGNAEALAAAYDVRRLTGAPVEIGPFGVRTARVNHPVETYAVRLAVADRSLVYSADTGQTGALVELARETDLFLCEASFPDGAANPPDLHLTGGQAGRYAAAAGVGRLVLTHLPPWGDRQGTLDAAGAAYDGPVELAGSGVWYDI